MKRISTHACVYLLLACGENGQTPKTEWPCECTQTTRLGYAFSTAPSGEDEPIQQWVARDDNDDGIIDTTEMSIFSTIPTYAIGIGVNDAADTLAILLSDELLLVLDEDGDRVADTEIVAPISGTARSGPAIQGETAFVLQERAGDAEIVAVDLPDGESQEVWTARGRVGSGWVVLATAGAPNTFFIGDEDRERIWLVDITADTVRSFHEGTAPGRYLNYRQASGIAWGAGSDSVFDLYHGIDSNGDGFLDADETTLLSPAGSCPQANGGLGQLQTQILLMDSCLQEIVLWDFSLGEYDSVAANATFLNTFAQLPDPCQVVCE